MNPLAAPDPEPIRRQILDAATDRFSQYGYGKTTMAEIARDCQMSAANLYRYFENKADIAGELARHCLAVKLEKLEAVVAGSDSNVQDCVERWFITIFEHTWEMCHDQPRTNELVDDVCASRSDIVHQHYDAMRDLLAGVLRKATERGELHVEKPDDVARVMLTASVPFDVPHFLHMQSEDEHRHQAKMLARQLVNGLRK